MGGPLRGRKPGFRARKENEEEEGLLPALHVAIPTL